MSMELTQQEMHYLAMNIVGEELKEQGYEFLGVNSDLKKNPQFVALKDKTIHFVLVRAVQFPDDPALFDQGLINKMIDHAKAREAKLAYAGVGLGHGADYGKPPLKDQAYTQVYSGLKWLL
ncbi:MAG TPA: Na(+)-translocating NADH-quinone reductase subunit F [Flavobacteriaceae bacterium]|nr:Na(+)-translocating NADH-quinone reductase subunit F [Flavobacteriaceae bacterium]